MKTNSCLLFVFSLLPLTAEAGLTAYWTFDADYSSEINNDLYEGTPLGEPFTKASLWNPVSSCAAWGP